MNIQECAFYFNILLLHNIFKFRGAGGGGLITMHSWSNILWWRLCLASARLQCLILLTVWEGGGVKLKGVWSPGTVGVTSFDDGCAWLQTSYNNLFIRPSSDGTYYGMVMSVRVSVRVSVRPSVHPSVRPSVRPTLRPSGLRPPIFRTFLLHALTYWAEILHMTLLWCTTDQVRLSSLCVLFLKELCLFMNLE